MDNLPYFVQSIAEPKSLHMNLQFRSVLKISALLFISFYCLNACTKTDKIKSSSKIESFKEKFFENAHGHSKEVQDLINTLKEENERSGFVNKLPENCGLPVWDKLLLTHSDASSVATSTTPINSSIIIPGANSTIALIPLTNTNVSLSSVLIIESFTDTTIVKCLTTNDYLYNVTHATDINVTQSKNDLTLFLYMENHTFGTNHFYNVPPNALPFNTSIGDRNGNKHVEIKNVIPINSVVPWICVEYLVLCTVCYQYPCEYGLSYWYPVCTYVGGGGAPTGGGGNGGSGPAGGGGGGSGGQTGGGNGGNCSNLNAWYNENLVPCGGTPPPPDTPVLQRLSLYSAAINHVADSVFQLSMVVPQKEYSFIIVKNNQNQIYPKNIRTDSLENSVTPIWYCQPYETLLGNWHPHPDPSADTNNRPAPSNEDILELNSHGHQSKLNFTSFIDCGNIRFAFVIENNVKANTFFRNINFAKYDMSAVYFNSLYNNPLRSSNYQLAGIQAVVAAIGNASASGIGFYKSTNPQKTEYTKIN